MYSANLERFIQLCIADGILTEKEKEVLRKKAINEGIDPDEMMIYVEGLLTEKASAYRPKNEGTLRKCPNCGANIPSMVAECPECGYEIRGNSASETVKTFADKYQKAGSVNEQVKLIESFPVPNNKEDLLEFMTTAAPLAISLRSMPKYIKILLCIGIWFIVGFAIMIAVVSNSVDPTLGYVAGGFIIFFGIICSFMVSEIQKKETKAFKAINSHNNSRLSKSWETKFKQVNTKAQILKVSDPEFGQKMKIASTEYDRNKNKYNILIAVVWAIVVAMLITVCISGANANKRANTVQTEINTLIDNGRYSEANEYQLKILTKDHDGEIEYYNFLNKCVVKMCADGNISDAEAFIYANATYFEKKRDFLNSNVKYTEGEVIDALMKIVENAQNNPHDSYMKNTSEN